MTVVYVDFVNGNDDTGDGTAASPYKTIYKGTTGLTGGDECRIASGANFANLTGTVTFTMHSNQVVGVGTVFSNQLAAGDFIEDNAGLWWEVGSIQDQTHLTLYQEWDGTTESGVTSRKLEPINVEVTSSSEYWQQTNGEGTSTESMLKISGGWDLTTETQTGKTYVKNTYSSRYGYGLRTYYHDFLEISDLCFLRFYYGIYNYRCYDNYVHNIEMNSCYYYGFYGYYSYRIKVENCVFNANRTGLYLTSGYDYVVSGLIASGNTDYGLYVSGANGQYTNIRCCTNDDQGLYITGDYSILTNIVADHNYAQGVYLSGTGCTLNNVVCQNNSDYGIQISGNGNRLKNITVSNNSYAGVYFYSNCSGSILFDLVAHNNGYKAVRVDNGGVKIFRAETDGPPSFYSGSMVNAYQTYVPMHKTDGYSELCAFGGYVNSQEATAGGTGIEWQINVTSSSANANAPISLKVAVIAVIPDEKVTVSLYFKKSNATSIGARLYCMGGQLAGIPDDVYTNCPEDTNRNKVTIEFTPMETGVVEIFAQAWYISNTPEYVIIDDIEITQ